MTTAERQLLEEARAFLAAARRDRDEARRLARNVGWIALGDPAGRQDVEQIGRALFAIAS